MKKVWKYRTLLTAAILLLQTIILAQGSVKQVTDNTVTPPSNNPFFIRKIYVSGNVKTREFVIKRELPFSEGDSMAISELVEKFRIGKQQLVNTRLFNDVVVSLKGFSGYDIDIQVDVKERWYIFPIPYVKPVDRNLSAWAAQGYSLSRLNFGAKFTYYNTTGRNDRLRLWLITGYSRQVQASYDQPFADRTLKHGYGFNFNYAALKEVNVQTIDNKQVFLRADSVPKAGKFLQENWGSSIQYTYRPALKTRYLFRLGFVQTTVDSAILARQPKYLSNSGKSRLVFPEFTYTITHINADYAAYPLRGTIGELSVYRAGLGKEMNLWSLGLKGVKAWPLKWKSSISIQANALLKLPFEQPFINQRMLGYGDFYLRGLEKYVIDGVAGGVVRNTARHQLFDFTVKTPVRSRSHDRVPFRIFAKAFSDLGYAYNKENATNSMANRFLYTAGAGVDIVTLYDVVFRFEYSFNQFGQNGMFFHFRNDF